ncbi:hypothetical protein JA1_003049 [Spathaspora sp. JA1]|nr:hypothetical protein JA1_003049 [Spathaspora sp. JA1]
MKLQFAEELKTFKQETRAKSEEINKQANRLRKSAIDSMNKENHDKLITKSDHLRDQILKFAQDRNKQCIAREREQKVHLENVKKSFAAFISGFDSEIRKTHESVEKLTGVNNLNVQENLKFGETSWIPPNPYSRGLNQPKQPTPSSSSQSPVTPVSQPKKVVPQTVVVTVQDKSNSFSLSNPPPPFSPQLSKNGQAATETTINNSEIQKENGSNEPPRTSSPEKIVENITKTLENAANLRNQAKPPSPVVVAKPPSPVVVAKPPSPVVVTNPPSPVVVTQPTQSDQPTPGQSQITTNILSKLLSQPGVNVPEKAKQSIQPPPVASKLQVPPSDRKRTLTQDPGLFVGFLKKSSSPEKRQKIIGTLGIELSKDAIGLESSPQPEPTNNYEIIDLTGDDSD